MRGNSYDFTSLRSIILFFKLRSITVHSKTRPSNKTGMGWGGGEGAQEVYSCHNSHILLIFCEGGN